MIKNEIRVPSTTIDLILMLANILREHLKLDLTKTECWTLQHTASWEIKGKDPGPDANEHDWFCYNQYENPIESHDLYLGRGYCWAKGFGKDPEYNKKIELRVRCECVHTPSLGITVRDIQLWIKAPNESVQAYHFVYDLGFGNSRQTERIEKDSKMPKYPPNSLTFWKQPNEQNPDKSKETVRARMRHLKAKVRTHTRPIFPDCPECRSARHVSEGLVNKKGHYCFECGLRF